MANQYTKRIIGNEVKRLQVSVDELKKRMKICDDRIIKLQGEKDNLKSEKTKLKKFIDNLKDDMNATS